MNPVLGFVGAKLQFFFYLCNAIKVYLTFLTCFFHRKQHFERQMNYIEIKISAQPMSELVSDLLSAMLGEAGCDSFETCDDCLKAYCPANLYDKDEVDSVLSAFALEGVQLTWEACEVETQNWNAQWEAENTLLPIQFGEQQITIHPCMSFGSGHHETTSQLLEEILLLRSAEGCFPASVLDMGTGTGVLAIACALSGAQHVRAIEIDDWVAENAVDNVLLNNQAGVVKVECGDVSLLGHGERYDVVLANINRNVLLADMHAYVADMNAGAVLLMSGFYEEDVPCIRQCAEALGLTYLYHRNRNNWVVIKFCK